MSAAPVTRRDFLKASLGAGGSLVLSGVPGATWAEASAANARPVQLDHFVRIEPGNRFVIGSRCPEIGQGVKTALPMLIAEELDVRWQDVTVAQMPLSIDFSRQPPEWRYGDQGAGGSTSVTDA